MNKSNQDLPLYYDTTELKICTICQCTECNLPETNYNSKSSVTVKLPLVSLYAMLPI